MKDNSSAFSINGLTKNEAEERIKKFGLNKLPEKKPPANYQFS